MRVITRLLEGVTNGKRPTKSREGKQGQPINDEPKVSRVAGHVESKLDNS